MVVLIESLRVLPFASVIPRPEIDLNKVSIKVFILLTFVMVRIGNNQLSVTPKITKYMAETELEFRFFDPGFQSFSLSNHS